MKHWSLVALGLLAVVGCQKNASHEDTTPPLPIDQTTITGATVSRVPITPPPAVDERDMGTMATSDGGAPVTSPAPATQPESTVSMPHSGASAFDMAPARRRVSSDVNAPASTFPESSFGSSSGETARGGGFPETTFGDYNTPAPGSTDRGLDAGVSRPSPYDIPR